MRRRPTFHRTEPVADYEDIVNARNQGEGKSGIEPDAPSNRDPKSMVNGVQQHEEYSRNLRDRIRLSEDAGPKIAQFRGGVQHRCGGKDTRVTAEHEDCVAPRDLVYEGKHKKQRAQQQFVGDGVEVLPQFCLLMQATGKFPIQEIADSSGNQQPERPIMVSVDDVDDNEGNKNETQQGQLVGEVEQLPNQSDSPSSSWAGSAPVLV